jgi:cell pole-organizing protein PopZ
MEEILASIRRIIADDDSARPPPAPAKPVIVPAPVAAPSAAAVDLADVEAIGAGFDDPETPDIAANDVFELGTAVQARWREDTARVDRRPGDVQGLADRAGAPARPEHAAVASMKPEPARPESAKRESLPREQAMHEQARREPARTGPPRPEPPRHESSRHEPSRSELPRSEPPKSEPPRSEPPKSEPPRSEQPRSEPLRSEAPRPEAIGPEPIRPAPRAAPAASPAVQSLAGEALLSPRTTAAVDLAFNTLAQTVLVQNSRTLDDLVREMLKPMLKAWLDDNLPNLVERLVRAEIERVSRGRG